MTDNELLREALDKASANLLAAARENARLRAVSRAAARENARLRAVVEAAMKVARPGTLPACLTEQARFHTNALKDLDSALSALDAKGGG